MIHCRYVINFADKWKTAKTAEAARLKIHCDDYSEIIAEFRIKNQRAQAEDRTKRQKRRRLRFSGIRNLTQAVNELSEQIEELRTRKNTILANLNTKDIQTVKD